MPASGVEEATDFKPDHRVIRMPLVLEKISFSSSKTTKNQLKRMASPLPTVTWKLRRGMLEHGPML
eukprot:4186698-Amphidinium_carterae.2